MSDETDREEISRILIKQRKKLENQKKANNVIDVVKNIKKIKTDKFFDEFEKKILSEVSSLEEKIIKHYRNELYVSLSSNEEPEMNFLDLKKLIEKFFEQENKKVKKETTKLKEEFTKNFEKMIVLTKNIKNNR